ncbi:hypothetical protein ACTBCG_003337 [Providencia rettgeri]
MWRLLAGRSDGVMAARQLALWRYAARVPFVHCPDAELDLKCDYPLSTGVTHARYYFFP